MINGFFKCEQHGRMPGDERRKQIIETAISLFSQRGFNGTTTKEIAKAAGVSEAMVFKHFSTKDELYDAILDNKVCSEGMDFLWNETSVLRKAMDERDDDAVFYQIALHALNKHHADIGFMRLLFYSALEKHEFADRFFSEFVSKVYGIIGGYIEQRQQEGAMREIDTKAAVRAFLGMLIHHSLNNILWDRERKLVNLTNEEAAKHFSQILLHGILK